MHARSIFLSAFILTSACFSVCAQTQWSVVQEVQPSWVDNVRVAYADVSFHAAWSEDNGYPYAISYTRVGSLGVPSLPFELRIDSQSMGGDPEFGVPKELNIRYATRYGEFLATIQEGDYLRIPDYRHTQVGPGLADDTVQIIYANYKSFSVTWDVSRIIEDALFHTVQTIAGYGFVFSNLGFEVDGTPLFLGDDGYEPHYVQNPLEGLNRRVEDFNLGGWFDGAYASSIAYGNGTYVAGLSVNENYRMYDPLPCFVYSADLENWTTVSFPPGYFVEKVVFEDGLFMAVGYYDYGDYYYGPQEGVIYSSQDGVNWSRTHFADTPLINDIVYTENGWMVVGDSGAVYSSPSGFLWSKVTTSGISGDLTAVNYGNSTYVAGNTNGAIYSSLDSINWVQQGSYNGTVNDIAVSSDKFMAGVGNKLIESDFAPSGIADITTQPASAYIVPGDQVTLSVGALGDTLSYQWYEGYRGDESNPVSGATAPTFQTPSLNQTSRYWVKVSNPVGVEHSSTATLTLQVQPAIIRQPEGVTIYLGEYVSGSVSASGNNLSYQWYEGLAGDNSLPVGGETSSNLHFRAENAGVFNYWVQISNGIGSINSQTIQVVVDPIYPQIINQPADLTRNADANQGTQFYVEAVGPLLSYQWYEGFSGDTSNPIPYRNYNSHYASDDVTGTFYFWVRVSNPVGYADSRTAVFTVNPAPPVIVEQPQDTSIEEGKSARLSVDVDYRSGTTYQWYEGQSGDTTTAVSNGQSSTAYIYDLTAGTHPYWVRITNPDGSTDSITAYVVVNPESYASWLVMEGLPTDESGISAPEYSAPGSRFSNLLRYMMGAGLNERLTGTTAFQPGLEFVNNEPHATLQFRMRNNIQDGTLLVEESIDLATWTETAEEVSVIDNGDGTVTCTYRTSGQISSNRYFLRLRASAE